LKAKQVPEALRVSIAVTRTLSKGKCGCRRSIVCIVAQCIHWDRFLWRRNGRQNIVTVVNISVTNSRAAWDCFGANSLKADEASCTVCVDITVALAFFQRKGSNRNILIAEVGQIEG
jgi:hypothetical protein